LQLPQGFAQGDIHRGCAEASLFDFAAAKERESERFAWLEAERRAAALNA
jgi:hypothetical protein